MTKQIKNIPFKSIIIFLTANITLGKPNKFKLHVKYFMIKRG